MRKTPTCILERNTPSERILVQECQNEDSPPSSRKLGKHLGQPCYFTPATPREYPPSNESLFVISLPFRFLLWPLQFTNTVYNSSDPPPSFTTLGDSRRQLPGRPKKPRQIALKTLLTILLRKSHHICIRKWKKTRYNIRQQKHFTKTQGFS